MTPPSTSHQAVSVYRPSEAGRWLATGLGRVGVYVSTWKGGALGPVIEQNPLDLLDVSPPNGRGFPTRPPDSGWFSDDLNFDPQRLLPRDGRSCRSDFGGSSGAVPASFLHFVYTEVSESRTDGSSGMSPPRSERLNRQSVGFVQLTRPMQSGEECCKKRILTSVIAVPFRRAWF